MTSVIYGEILLFQKFTLAEGAHQVNARPQGQQRSNGHNSRLELRNVSERLPQRR